MLLAGIPTWMLLIAGVLAGTAAGIVGAAVGSPVDAAAMGAGGGDAIHTRLLRQRGCREAGRCHRGRRVWHRGLRHCSRALLAHHGHVRHPCRAPREMSARSQKLSPHISMPTRTVASLVITRNDFPA